MLVTLGRRRLAGLARSMKHRVFRARPIEGLPPGVAFETLDALCRRHLRQGLGRCAYVHLSSWKPHGTWRLELTTTGGRKWPLIFKNERYTTSDIPALEALPIRPGPPEFAVYQAQSLQLRRFIPEVYLSREIEPGCHFQYIMEDLRGALEPIRFDRQDLITAIHALLQLQEALKQTWANNRNPYLIVYDRRYSERLLDYVRHNLEAFCTSRDVPAVAELCRSWQRIVDVHQRGEFYQHGLATPIHGDYNRSNVHVHPRDRTKVKVVDWEWAGIGLPHADLAAVLKRAHPADERAALDVFAGARGDLDAESHQRLFRWCRLERRLLDAGFIARQQLRSPRQLPWLETFISGAATDALRTAELLAVAPRRPAVV